MCRFDADFPKWPHSEFDWSFAAKWFQATPELDAELKAKFADDVEAAASGDYDEWLDSSFLEGFAGMLLLDQISHNIRRGTEQQCVSPFSARDSISN